MLHAYCQDLGNVDVIELLRRPRAFFKLLALDLIDRGDRDQLQQDRFMRPRVDGFIINGGPAPADW